LVTWWSRRTDIWGNSAKKMMNAPFVAIHNLELDPNCHLTSRISGSMRMLGVFGGRMSVKNSRVVCLIV
jgi:hypothetical protein